MAEDIEKLREQKEQSERDAKEKQEKIDKELHDQHKKGYEKGQYKGPYEAFDEEPVKLFERNIPRDRYVGQWRFDGAKLVNNE